MNTPGFIPENLKAARLLLELSQAELARLCGMQQKDISLHESKDTKRLIPVRYILVLASKGIDLNTLFRPGTVRLLDKMELLNMAAEPQAPYHRLRKAIEPERRLRASVPKHLSAEQWEKLLRLLAKEEPQG